MPTVPVHRVKTRSLWAAAWQEVPDLTCSAFSVAVGGELSTASLAYTYGHVLRRGQLVPAAAAPLDLAGKYVRVELGPASNVQRTWHGLVIEQGAEEQGLLSGATPTGRQQFSCVGLEYLLRRQIVDQSVIGASPGVTTKIQRAIPFNRGAGHEEGQFGNNRSDDEPDGVPVFASDLAEAQRWSAGQILKYLVHYFAPANQAGDQLIPWKITGRSDALDFWFPQLDAHGRNLADLIGSLASPQRLMNWRAVVNASDQVEIRLFTLADQDIDLPGGVTIPANDDTASWDFDSDRTVLSALVSENQARQFNQVVCRSERVGYLRTISGYDGTNQKDWDSTQQTAYNAGASAADAYSAMDRLARQNAHREIRTDDALERVYAYFRVPSTGNDLVLDLPGTDPENGKIVRVWRPGLRFEPRLPLLIDHDYSGERIRSGTVTDNTPNGARPEFRRPFGTVELAGRHYMIDRLPSGESVDVATDGGGREYSVSIQVRDEDLGVILRVRGAPQHLIAKEEFSAVDDDDAAYYPAEIRWQDIRVTVYQYLDRFAEGKWPDPAVPNGNDVQQVWVILVKRLHLDYAASGTVVGVDKNGVLLTTTSSGWVRDDRQKLQDLARAAYQWQGRTRRSLEVTRSTLSLPTKAGGAEIDVGTRITTIGQGREAQTVVTKIDTDLERGATRVFTQFAELDVSGL